jgi:hypothetical protein
VSYDIRNLLGRAAVLRTLPVVFAPLFTSIWLARQVEGAAGARRLVAKFFAWRVSPLWTLVAVGVFPLRAGLALLVRWSWERP